jgi:hypothetical protein
MVESLVIRGKGSWTGQSGKVRAGPGTSLAVLSRRPSEGDKVASPGFTQDPVLIMHGSGLELERRLREVMHSRVCRTKSFAVHHKRL